MRRVASAVPIQTSAKEIPVSKRKIVHIDEEKCDGCGLCVPSCAEGAIQIVDGKARLVSDVYCDGLGACLGECPRDAIKIVEREADEFDEEAARRHVGRIAEKDKAAEVVPAAKVEAAPLPCGCPGTAARMFQPSPRGHAASPSSVDASSDAVPSALGHWPVQLALIPPTAPFLQEADLLLAADCAPVALADFHRRFLRGRPVAIACPKLDNAEAHVEKLAAVLRASSVRSVTVVHMEVPCCTGLVRIAREAIARSGRDVPLEDVVVTVHGEVADAGKTRPLGLHSLGW
ncbi:MAG: 4Fe-4S binding protein [Pirellulaceae bacterium]|nr:4Fe-4S binding protein [Pirellulaceae bacterium]